MLRFQVDLKLGVTLFNPVHWVKSISLSERRKQRNKESTKLAVRGGIQDEHHSPELRPGLFQT